jgi:hypothetical protein
MLNLQHPNEYAQTCPFPKFGLSCVVNYAETLILMYYFILIVRTIFLITHQFGRGLHCIPLDIHTCKGQYLVHL